MFARSAAALLLVLASACAAQPPVDESGTSSSSTTDEPSSSGEPDSTSSSSGDETTGDESSSGAPSSSGTSGEDSSGSTGTDTDTGTGESSSTGTLELCGDGKMNPGEQCDFGGETKICDSDCTVALCGDLYTNMAAGEECDDGNVNDEDGCLSNCKLPACGDGLLQVGEVCDDGNGGDGDGCEVGCTLTPLSFMGVKKDILAEELVGWKKCYQAPELMNATTLAVALSFCKKPRLLLACGNKITPEKYSLAAHAMRTEVTSYATMADPLLANGAVWVNDATSFGFGELGTNFKTAYLWELNAGLIHKTLKCGAATMGQQYHIYQRD